MQCNGAEEDSAQPFMCLLIPACIKVKKYQHAGNSSKDKRPYGQGRDPISIQFHFFVFCKRLPHPTGIPLLWAEGSPDMEKIVLLVIKRREIRFPGSAGFYREISGILC